MKSNIVPPKRPWGSNSGERTAIQPCSSLHRVPRKGQTWAMLVVASGTYSLFLFFSTISILYWIGWSSSTYQNGSVVAFLSGLLFQVHLPATHVDDEWHEQRTCGPSHLVRPSWSADAFSRRWLTTLLGILCMTFPEISDCIDDSKACRKSDVPQQTSTDNPKILHHFSDMYVYIYIMLSHSKCLEKVN